MAYVELDDFPDRRDRLYVVIMQAVPGVHGQAELRAEARPGDQPHEFFRLLPAGRIGVGAGVQLHHRGADLLRGGHRGRTVGIKLRFADFRTVTRVRTLPEPIDDPALIRRAAFECLARVELTRPIRLVGVKVEELAPRAAVAAAPAPPGGAAPDAAALHAPGAPAARTLPLFDDLERDGG